MKRVLNLLILLALITISTSAALADSKLTLDEFEKTLEGQKANILMVNITNGQNLLDVKMANEQVNKTVEIPADQRKKVIQQIIAAGVPLQVHDSLIKWMQYKLNVGKVDGGLDCAHLSSLIAENKANTIEHVDDYDNTNILDVKLSGAQPDEVVMPAEIKEDVAADLASKGVKVDHKPAKQDYSLILPAFVAGVVLLGIVYLLVPMRLGSEVNPRPTMVNNSTVESKPDTTGDAS